MELAVKSWLLGWMAVVAVALPHEGRRARHKLGADLETHVCDGDHDNQRSELMREVICSRPRDEFVELPTEGSHVQLYPSAVWVKRCKGVCYNSAKACMATKKQDRHVPVRYIDVSTGKETCAIFTLEEHLECGCQCPISQKDCKSGERFNHRKCKCECRNLEGRRKCLAEKVDGKHLNVWSRSKCACEKREKL